MAVSAFILAGEASGDRLAAQLMDAGNDIFSSISWFGVGGPQMQARHLDNLADMDRLAVIGIGDALAQYRALSALADRLIAEILKRQPDYVFTVDSKGFSLRFAARLRRALGSGSYQPKLVHMVAPTVWAWGAWRAKKFSQLFDHIFCLFPFEPDYFNIGPSEQGAQALFVGHPDADGIARPVPELPDKPGRDTNLHILLLPGSRQGEIMRHMPILLDACSHLLDTYPALRLTLPLLPHLHPAVAPFLEQTDIGSHIELSDKPVAQAFSDAHFMLASSGTVTLEAAIAGVPGVVIYHLGLTSRLFAKFLFEPKTPVLPDIILQTNAYPFLISPHLNAHNLAPLAQQGLQDITARNAEMQDLSRQLKATLSPDGKPFAERLRAALQRI